MDSERIFKTCIFGGFKREDVLQYVGELQAEIASLSEELQKKSDELSALSAKVNELEALCEAGEQAKQQLTVTTGALETAQQQSTALQAENEDLRTQLSGLDDEKRKMEEKAQELRATQAQLGAAFLDARKYSDEIVNAANQRANETQADAAQSIREQASEIARLSADVDSISATLSKSVEDLHAQISALSAKLSKAAQALSVRRDAEKFLPDVSMHISPEISEAFSETEQGKSEQNIYRFGASKEG